MEAGKRGGNGHTNEAFRCSLAAANSRSRVFEVVENAQSRLVKVATWLSQCNGARGAVNQFGAELIFKGGNLLADRRLTDSQFPGNGGEAPSFHDPDEYPHRVQLIHSGLLISLVE